MQNRLAVAAFFAVTLVAASTLAGCAAAPAPPAPNSTGSNSAVQAVIDDAWAALQAQYPNAARPQVEVVRMVTTDEWATVMVDCLEDEGYPYATAPGDGSVVWSDVPDAQVEAFDIARFKCSAMYPRDPAHQEPLKESQLDRLYDYYSGEMTQCLTALGYDVPSAPSRETFRETYATDPWLPFEDAYANAGSPEAAALLEDACPQIPADLWE